MSAPRDKVSTSILASIFSVEQPLHQAAGSIIVRSVSGTRVHDHRGARGEEGLCDGTTRPPRS